MDMNWSMKNAWSIYLYAVLSWPRKVAETMFKLSLLWILCHASLRSLLIMRPFMLFASIFFFGVVLKLLGIIYDGIFWRCWYTWFKRGSVYVRCKLNDFEDNSDNWLVLLMNCRRVHRIECLKMHENGIPWNYNFIRRNIARRSFLWTGAFQANLLRINIFSVRGRKKSTRQTKLDFKLEFSLRNLSIFNRFLSAAAIHHASKEYKPQTLRIWHGIRKNQFFWWINQQRICNNTEPKLYNWTSCKIIVV